MTVDIWISYEKNISGLYGSWTHHLCDTGAVLYQLGARHFVGSYLIREVMFITAFPSDQLFNQFSEKTESGVIVNNNSLKKPIGRQSANSAPTVSRQVFSMELFYVITPCPLDELVSTWEQKQFKLVCLPR